MENADLSDAPTSATLRGRNRLASRSPGIWSSIVAPVARMGSAWQAVLKGAATGHAGTRQRRARDGLAEPGHLIGCHHVLRSMNRPSGLVILNDNRSLFSTAS